MPRRLCRSALISVSMLALGLTACNKSSPDTTATTANSGLPALPAALPMQTGPAVAITPAAPISALPAPRSVGISRPADQSSAYAYLDRASDVEDEIGDAPPDYDYDDDQGVSPWVWQTQGGDGQYAEPVDGGYRYYYYQPGANYPYLVRTRDYSYAYAGGALVAIYTLAGALLPPDQYAAHRADASRYFWHAQQLRQAADQRPHRGVNAANWAQQRPQISAAQTGWATARSQQSDWQAYHAQHDPAQQTGWQQEHQQRQQVAQQFAGWQSRGLSGPPPHALAAPVVAGRAQPPADHRGLAAGQHRQTPALVGPQAAAPTVQATAQRQQHLAEAQHQAQEAARQQATAQHEAAAQQQAIANVHRQQAMAAQEQVLGHQQAQQREAMAAAHQEQLRALAAQRHAEMTRPQPPRINAPAFAHPEGAEFAPPPRPEAGRPSMLAPRPPETRPPAPAFHAPTAHPEAPHEP